jgi:predicted ATPase
MSLADRPLGLRRLLVRNFRSIAECDVRVGPLALLIGRSGAGRSNVLDALRFLRDSVKHSLDHAIRVRGGIDEVRRRSMGHPRNFTIGVELDLPQYDRASFQFEITARPTADFAVKQERCSIRNHAGSIIAEYTRNEHEVSGSEPDLLPVARGGLVLQDAGRLPAFRHLHDSLLNMSFHDLNPGAMRELHTPDAGERLDDDGANVASVVARLRRTHPDVAERIEYSLSTMIPGIESVERVEIGPKETLLFKQWVKGDQPPWKFHASSISAGALRALGVLVAVMHTSDSVAPVRLVGIEEPETGLHPAAAGALLAALRKAASHAQVVLTTHSPDLIDHAKPEDTLLVVYSEENETRVAHADSASLPAIRKHLCTAGESLLTEHLNPSRSALDAQAQTSLFSDQES